MKFPYAAYEVQPSIAGEKLVYRPVIRVTFIGSMRTQPFWALLDTGADESYITEEMGNFLGIEPLPIPTSTVQSASGTMPVIYGQLTIEISQDAERFTWPIMVGIVTEPWPEAILGHRGFLEFFDATFFGAQKEVTLVRNAVPLPASHVH